MSELGAGSQEVGDCAEAQVAERGQEEDEKRPGMGIASKVHHLCQLPEPHQDQQRPQQVCPHVDRLVVSPEEGQEIVAPVLVQWPVACVDVTLSEEVGHLTVPQGGWQAGHHRHQPVGHLLLGRGQTAAPLHGNSHHDRSIRWAQPKLKMQKS